MKLYSQPMTKQDEWVIRWTRAKRFGYFVEVGAHDGVRHSNTLALEESLQWNGILIEPEADLYKKLCVNRPNAKKICKVVDRRRNHLEFVTGIGMSNAFSGLKCYMPDEWLAEHRKRASSVDFVDTYGLTELLYQAEAPYDIDYLSLDVEGAELAILEGVLESRRFKFNLMTVEFRYDAMLLERLEALLGSEYRLDEIRAFDACFVHKDYFSRRAAG